ncbi:MAG: NAD(P)/FAD-dependent oxidoreductase [Bacillota bacterium]|nr:NAD(P)/FAD-dependent oxidoreductase [Bacillota bacterium]
MSKMFPNLFSPAKIGNLEIKNRVVKAPQSTGLSNMDGSVSERLIRHYRELAKGGTGLVIVEYAFVDNIASKSAHCQLGISNTEHIPGLGWLADVIKDNGAVAGIQIEHCGRQKFLGTKPMKSASQIPWPKIYEAYGTVPDAMTIEEIEQLVEDFGDAAVRAVSAGFELIEIHGAHGYLITNFLSPHTNKRNDLYGGCLENRMRILVQIVNNIRSKIGYDFPLTVRLSGTDYEPDGLTIEDTIEMCKKMEQIGLDAIHVSGGDHHMMIHQVTPMALPVCYNTWAAERIKKEISIPVIASGSITLPQYAEDIIASGKGDFVGLGRPLWADQYWPKKAEADHPEDIRPCIRCNEGCLERTFFLYKNVTCALNPTIGREEELVIKAADTKKKVAVVGGGPAGMETARVCALRGHEVTLFEKRKLGGYLHEASVPEFKADIRPLMQYLIHQVEKLDIKVVEAAADKEMLQKGGFDAVVVAVGAEPIDLKVPGADKALVVNALDVLSGKVKPGKELVVIGGGLIGTETALDFAEQGSKVSVVEMQDEIMTDVAVTDKLAYSDRIAKTDMKIYTSSKMTEVTDSGVIVSGRKGTLELQADMVLVAVGLAPVSTLYQELKETGMETYRVGDCVKAGKIYDAMHTAYKTSLNI